MNEVLDVSPSPKTSPPKGESLSAEFSPASPSVETVTTTSATVSTEAPTLSANVAPVEAPLRVSLRSRLNWWPVRVPAILTGLMGLINLLSSVTPSLPERMIFLRDLLPFGWRHEARISHLTTALAGFALLVLSSWLWRRKSVAWVLTMIALFVSIVGHLLKGLDYEEASFALLLMGWLWFTRRQFHARSDAPSVRRGLIVLGAAFAFTLVYGTVGFFLLDTHYNAHFGWQAALAQTVTMFTQFSDPGLQPLTGFGRFFADSIYTVALVTIGYAALQVARPVIQRRILAPSEMERVQTIVEAHGRNGFAFCALLPDKLYWFSQRGSVVAYALVGRVAVAMGDPIGPREDEPRAIEEFCQFCHQNDWRPAFYEVYEDNLAAHRKADLEVLRIAHEAVIDLNAWTLDGKSNKNFRNALNSMTKGGYRATVHEAPLSDELLAQLREVSDEWLAMMHGSEKGFSLGWFYDDYIRACPVMAIHDPEGNILAFANLVSSYNLNESTIDLMRRRTEIPKMTMEFLFLSLFEWAKGRDYDTFNLGPSPFAMVGEHSEDPATERALHFLYEHVNGFYNFKGLHAFKEKFHPFWRPLFLSYEGKAGLPVVAAAIVRADSGQNSWWDFLKGLRGEAREV